MKVTISNFGRVNANLFRGAQPKSDEYAQLAAMGIHTCIDLRDDPEPTACTHAKLALLRYINLPMSDHDYPVDGTAEKFLALVTAKMNWPVYVHCAGGRHRTGFCVAVYRMRIDGWSLDDALAEMNSYGLNWFRWLGHGAIKRAVKDYWAELQAGKGGANEENPHR